MDFLRLFQKKKRLKFVLSKRDNIIIFNISFILLPAKIDLILEKQSCKKNILKTCGTGYIKIVFTFLTKVIAFNIWVTIVQIAVLGLQDSISICKVCFAMFLAFNKQF